MEILKVIQGRRSIRAYRSDLVNIDKLRDLVLQTAIWAPSAGNAQILRYIVVTDHSMLHKIELVSPGLSGNPPALIVVCQDSDEAQLKGGSMGPQFLAIADAAMATQNIMLFAYSLGLGTCVIASFDRGALQTILSLPRSIVSIFIVSVGYPDCSPKAPARKKEVIWFNEYK
jgi:nitroreductase